MSGLPLMLIQFLIFITLYLFTFYPFGLLLIDKYRPKLEGHEKILLSLLLSTVGFVILAYAVGVVRARFVVLPVVVGLNAYGLWKLRYKALIPWKEFFKDKILIFLLFLAILVQGAINFPSGYMFKEGLLFWSSQGNDGLWHVAVMEEIKKSMPPENPVYAGENLYNYHYLNDIQMGEFGRIYPFFSSLDIYFRFFPVILSFLINLSVFSFINYWKKNRGTGYWAILFTSLFGNFGYIVTLIKQKQLFAGETIFWASQGNTIIGNPPHAAAYGLLGGALFCISVFLRTKDRFYLLLSFILGALLAGFKVSGGAVLVAGIVFAGLVDLLVNKKKSLIFLGLALALSNYGVLKLMTKGAGSFLIFEPWWFVRTTITAGGRVEWIDLELRRQFYLDRGGWRSILRIIEYEAIAFVIFTVGNIGTKAVGLFAPFKNGLGSLKEFFADKVNLILLGILLSSLGVVLLFVQRGIAYNLIQFMQYFILAFGFFAAVSVDAISKKIKSQRLKAFLATLLIVASVPTVIGNIVEFYGKGRTALAKISNFEVEALGYLRNNTPEDVVILTYPFDKDAHWGYENQPWPISGWYSTAYVSAISSRRTYFTNEGQSDILGLPVQERLQSVQKIFDGKDIGLSKDLIRSSNIAFIYLIKSEINTPLDVTSLGLSVFFENDEVIIYRVI